MKTSELDRASWERTGMNKLRTRGAAAMLAALVLAALPAGAGDGTWTGKGNQACGQAIWGGLANWVNNTVADGASSTATFGNSFSNCYTVSVNTAKTIGNIVFTDPVDANDLVLTTNSSNYTLTLAVTNGSPTVPTIKVTQADRTLLIIPRLGGTKGFTKLGPGSLVLSNANPISGVTTLQAGTLILAHGLALSNSVLDTANSLAGDPTNGLKSTVTSLTLGGLSGGKDFASVFTTASGGYDTVTDLTLNPGSGVSASYSGLIADGAAGMTLTKNGGGTQTLGAVNSYTGATTVNAGTLKVVAAATASAHTAVTVAGGATLGVLVTSDNGQWANTGDLTQQDTSTLVIDYGSSVPATTVAPLKVANLSLGAGLTLQVTAASFAGFAANQSYPLITWTGSGPADASAFSTLVLARRVVGNLSVVGKTLLLNMTASAAGPLNWNTGNGIWDTVTANWLDGALAPTTYEDLLDSVTLGDAAGVTGNPTVTMASALSPVNLTMNSTNHDYILTGAGGLTGTASLTLDAANTRTLTLATANTHSGTNTINGGTLVLSGNNTYTGPTIVNAGTLRLGANDVIPDGAGVANVTVNAGGTFDLNGLSESINGLTGSGSVDTLAGGTATLTVGTNNTSSTFSGSIRNTAGTLNLVKTGTGTFTLSGSNSFSGTVWIQAGALALGGMDALDGARGITIAGDAALTPNLSDMVVNTPITVSDTNVASRINAPARSDVGGVVFPFTLNGPISGPGDVAFYGIISLNTYGTIILNAQSTYSGSTLITCTPNSNAGVNCFVKLGTNNALPPTTVLTLDGLDGGGSGRTVQLDLNGFSQTLAGLQNTLRATNRKQQIVSTSATTGNLTVNSTNAYEYWYFTGDFGTPTASNFSLTKNGSGFLYLAGTVAYSGNTTVNGGTLDMAQPNLMASNSTVSIASGAMLQLDFSATNRVGALVLGGTRQPDGVYTYANAAPYLTGIGSVEVVTPVPPQPTIAPVTVSGTNLVVSVPTVSGFNYVLQSTTNLTPTVLWRNESTNAAMGSSLILNVPIEPGKPSKFLRFKVY